MDRKKRIIKLRKQGKTYRQIAKIVGLSYQQAYEIYSESQLNPEQLKEYKEKKNTWKRKACQLKRRLLKAKK